MMKRITSGLALAAMALAFVVGSSTRADAGFLLAICDTQFCNGGTSALIFDNQSGDLNPADGRITAFEGAIGGFNTFDVETALSQPRDGAGPTPLLDITYQATGTGDVYLYASDTDFTGSGGTAIIQNNGNHAGGGSVTTAIASLYGGNTNINDTTPLIGSISGLVASGSFPFTPGVDPFGLTLEFHIAATGGVTTGDLSAEVVPEPVTMALFGLGLLGTGIARRRRIV